MSDDLILISNPMSRGRIARWMLEEVGQPYDVEYRDYDAMQAPEFRALNPLMKVPVLRHGAAVVSETAAICAYLAAAFPEAGLMPAAGTPESAAYHRWMFFAAGPVEAAVTARSMNLLPPPERSRMVGYGSFERVMDTLEAAVSRSDHVAGDRFTAADVYVGSQVGYGLAFNSIEPRPAFVAYFDRIKDRPASVRARELDDAAMPSQAA